jgi:hypothetical protein
MAHRKLRLGDLRTRGFGEEGNVHGTCGPTGQQGLWFHAGMLAQCRIFSKVLRRGSRPGASPNDRARFVVGQVITVAGGLLAFQ